MREKRIKTLGIRVDEPTKAKVIALARQRGQTITELLLSPVEAPAEASEPGAPPPPALRIYQVDELGPDPLRRNNTRALVK